MKDIILTNGRVRAHVNPFGAELKGLEMDGLEYLWQGDPLYYGRTSPTLFPIMGRFLSDTYYVGDKAYHMTPSGFAMDRNFSVEEQSETRVTFCLQDDERTYAAYPFHFTLRVTYELKESRMAVTFRVDNQDEKTLPFCVGLHTAYRWPLEGENPDACYLRFEKKEQVGSFNPFNWKDPGFIRDGFKQLNHQVFANFTRSMTNIQSDYIEYASNESTHGVRIHRAEMPFLAMWTLPDESAKFVCLEPSTSVHAGAATTIEDRLGTMLLPAGETCRKHFEIELF